MGKKTMELLTEKKDLVEKLAEVLLEKEVLEREDMVDVLGPRPWAEKTSYDDFVAGTGDREEDNSLPAGLKHWNSTKENVESTPDNVKFTGEGIADIIVEVKESEIPALETGSIEDNLTVDSGGKNENPDNIDSIVQSPGDGD